MKSVVIFPLFILSLLNPVFVGAVSFTNIVEDYESGIDYAHKQTSRYDTRQSQYLIPSQQQPLIIPQVIGMPIHVPGKGAVLLIDYDNDGDTDIFASNVKGTANSFFQNQLMDTGQLVFIDVAVEAGIDAPSHQGSGACYADIDNDNDQDIFVVGDDDNHRLYLNLGNGTFKDITIKSNSTFKNSTKGGTSCSFGDIDNDGFVDLHVAHGFDFDSGLACFAVPFDRNIANELYHNDGNGVFSDISAQSGIHNLANIPPGAHTITWSTALVDYDQDGDVDIFSADDNCGIPPAKYGGVDRGYIQIWNNDGQGHFNNVTLQAGTNKPGQWMGLNFADLNQDGHLDFFATNMGDYLLGPVLNSPIKLGESASRMFISNGDGTFSDPGASNLLATPFGWGVITEDLDNDGDTDVMFGGGIDLGFIIAADNPGSILINDGAGNFTADNNALAGRGTSQNVQGIAAGDLNNDGLVDIVTAANFDIPLHFPLIPSPRQVGGPFDATAYFVPTLDFVGPGLVSWTGLTYSPGSMRVEINNTITKNKSVTIKTMGSKAITTAGSVNRNGIGAIVFFTPKKGKTAIKPVTGGASHIAQNTQELTFGLGTAETGTIEVLWPGGVRNRLYEVLAGTNIVFPEIPCSFDTNDTPKIYKRCVSKALEELRNAGVIDKKAAENLFSGALHAYENYRNKT